MFKPMLADRVTDIERIEALLNNREFIVETKYDGERMQVFVLSIEKCIVNYQCCVF